MDTVRMRSYFAQLKTHCLETDVDLKRAFDVANVPSSTYYRAKKRNDMRYATAMKVFDAINRIYASETADKYRS